MERIDRLIHGKRGDTKPVGEGVWELRMTYAPGLPGLLPTRRDTLILLSAGATSRPNKQTSTGHANSPTTGTPRMAMTTKAEKCTRFDAADHLDNIEVAAAYLQIALEESANDPTAVPWPSA